MIARQIEYLTPIERNELEQHEATIERGLKTFYDVGTALLAIRDNRLYKAEYNTFEDYCQTRWRMSKTHANRLIEASGVIANLTPIGVIPANEAQARALTELEPDEQVTAWQTVLATANGKITAAHIQAVVDVIQDAPDPIKERVFAGELAPKTALELAKAIQDAPEQVQQVALESEVSHPSVVAALTGLYEKKTDTFSVIARTGALDGEIPLKDVTERDIENHLERAHREHVLVGVATRSPREALHSSNTNEWYTPPEYIESARQVMGSIDIDPASHEKANAAVKATTYYTVSDNGLAYPWTGRVWLNPPYGKDGNDSNQKIWTTRLIGQVAAGITTEAVLLVNAATDTEWFQPLWDYTICFTNHRIRFIDENGEQQSQPTHGNVFVYFGSNVERFTQEFGKYGVIARRLK